MNLGLTIIKATGLSALIFWTILLFSYPKEASFKVVPFFMISIIPITICCSITIYATIYPFFILKNKLKSNKDILKTYLPYYAIIVFSLCLFGAISSNFEKPLMAFLIAAFFTSIKSWFWLIETNKTHEIEN